MSFVLPAIQQINSTNKKILLRADLDVPLSASGGIENDMRLVAALPTIKYLYEQGATVYICGHLGRPGGMLDQQLRFTPIVHWLVTHLQITQSVTSEKMGEFPGWKLTDRLFLLDNLRFFQGEEANNPTFAQQLASLAELYVNDAFAVSHRSHASTVGVAKLLPHYAGIRLQEEVTHLQRVFENPKRPLVVVIGGKKIETKLPLVAKMFTIADYLLVGGKIAQEDAVLQEIYRKTKEEKAQLIIATLNQDQSDITQESLAIFLTILQKAQTIVWNGPMGKMEDAEGGKAHTNNTLQLATVIAKSPAYTIVGGGDTVEFLDKHAMTSQYQFVSTGGGAMLAFLSGEKLPALEALLA